MAELLFFWKVWTVFGEKMLCGLQELLTFLAMLIFSQSYVSYLFFLIDFAKSSM